MLDWIAAHAFEVVLGLAVAFGISGLIGKYGRNRRVLAVVFGVAVVVPVVLCELAVWDQLWIWALSVIPGAIVVLHGVHVAVFKNPLFFEESQDPDFSSVASEDLPFFKALHAQEKRYYSTTSLMLRFALPALVLALVVVVVGYSLFVWAISAGNALQSGFVDGAQMGAFGAYVAILLSLGGRAFRCDVTRGSIVNAMVTIVVGPILAGSLRLLFTGDAAASWNTLLLPFAAGFSLRYIVDFVDATIRRVFAVPSESSSRRVPLVRLRGITPDVEERLVEEGVGDVATLAAANPVRLRRNTPFDRRQILAWIDEAILMTYLPNTWQNLEADGITGALDLAWYGAVEHASRIEALAERNKLDDAALADTILRLADDVQVKTLRRLREYDETLASDEAAIFAGFKPDAEENGVGTRPSSDLETMRQATYAGHHELFVVHSWRRSKTKGQAVDVVVRLVQHGDDGPLTRRTVRRVTYVLGPEFGGVPAVKADATDSFSFRVCAKQSFLCIARVELTDGEQIDLERYVDFDARASA